MENSITTSTSLVEYYNSCSGELVKEGLCCEIVTLLLNLHSCWCSHLQMHQNVLENLISETSVRHMLFSVYSQ